MTEELKRPNTKHPCACETTTTQMKSPDKGRRQFIKTAIVTAPVILTVTSRPVWATNCTWSGQLSGNLSDAGDPCGGEGCNASFWQDELNADKWHYDFCQTKPFVEVFGMDAFPDGTLWDVINGQAKPAKPGNCNNQWQDRMERLGVAAVTALQNSATSVSFDLTVCQVIADFVDVFQYGDCVAIENAITMFNGYNNQGNCPFS